MIVTVNNLLCGLGLGDQDLVESLLGDVGGLLNSLLGTGVGSQCGGLIQEIISTVEQLLNSLTCGDLSLDGVGDLLDDVVDGVGDLVNDVVGIDLCIGKFTLNTY